MYITQHHPNKTNNTSNYLDVLANGELGSTSSPLIVQNSARYPLYAELISTGVQHIDTGTINNIEILDQYFFQLLDIFKDGIETKYVQNAVAYVHFVDNEDVKLSIFDLWFNLLFWGLPVSVGEAITTQYLFCFENMTQGTIAEYINTKFLKINRDKYTNMQINNMIDDVMYKFQYIEHFTLYLYNTANNEDTIRLMKEDPIFRDAIHCDLSNVSIEDIKDEGMRNTKIGIERILASGYHWAIPYFKAEEGINIKQFKELCFNIGTIPDGQGGVFPKFINTNFSQRGLSDPVDYLIEAARSREAQKLSHKNVSDSGAFARLIGLNNMDDRLYPDSDYVCDSKHFVKVTIKSKKMLSMYKNRYYRLVENGIEYKMSIEPHKDNADLVGKTLLFRSPITCASRTRGQGICHRCYGGLARTNYDINIGKIAAELLSAKLTQRMLSAKHILEANIRKLLWNDAFYKFFDIDFCSIRLKEDEEFKKYKLIIEQDSIQTDEDENEEDGAFTFSNYVTSFTIVGPKGDEYVIRTKDQDNMYFGVELEAILASRKTNDEDKYILPLDILKDMILFLIEAQNNELGLTLFKIKNLLNKKQEMVRLKTKDAVTQELVETVIDGGLNLDAIHLEMILSHQCVSTESNLLDPQWQYANEEHVMISLNERLRDNPSVTISLMYKDIGKLLFYPLTFMKSKASVMDLFYMTKPQVYMSMKPTTSNLQEDREVEGPIKPFTITLPDGEDIYNE